MLDSKSELSKDPHMAKKAGEKHDNELREKGITIDDVFVRDREE